MPQVLSVKTSSKITERNSAGTVSFSMTSTFAVRANSSEILDSVNGYRKVEAITGKKFANIASRANSLPGDYVQEQASLENDCLNQLSNIVCSLHDLCEETGSPVPCTSEANSANPRLLCGWML